MARATTAVRPEPILPAPPSPEPDGRTLSETHSSAAVGSGEGRSGRANAALKPKLLVPDLDGLHSLMQISCRNAEEVEKTRIGMQLRIGKLTKRGFGGLEDTLRLRQTLQLLEQAEKLMEAEAVELAKQHPMAAWIKAQPGIALPTFCKLFGVTGPLDRFANVAKLWHYLGMHVTNGRAPRKGEGVPGKIGGGSYSPRGAGICHVLGETIVRANKGLWREVYDKEKARQAVLHPELSAGHRDNRAKRVAVKALLAEMWGEWRRVCPLSLETQARYAAAASPSPLEVVALA